MTKCVSECFTIRNIKTHTCYETFEEIVKSKYTFICEVAEKYFRWMFFSYLFKITALFISLFNSEEILDTTRAAMLTANVNIGQG